MKARPDTSLSRLLLAASAALMLGGCLSFDDEGSLVFDPPDFSTGKTLATDLKDRIASHDSGAVHEFCLRGFQALHGNDPQELEKLQSSVVAVRNNAPFLPGIKEYESWLDSRMLYFDAIEDAKRSAEAAKAMAAQKKDEIKTIIPETQKNELHAQALKTGKWVERNGLVIPVREQNLADSLPRLPPTYLTMTRLADAPPEPKIKSAKPSAKSKPPPQAKAQKPDAMRGRAYWQKAVAKRGRSARAAEMASRISPVFKKAGLPTELVWMAEVESSMDPKAKSPVGAAGLFQLMPNTAKSLGLELKPNDQRLVPEQNARAAAAYLKQLYKRFGSWPLTLAAYNAGEGKVSSLCRKHKTRLFDDIAADLPTETQMYVPRVLETIRNRSGADPDTLAAPN